MGLRVRWKTLGGNLNTVDQKPDLYLAERVIIIYISLTCHGPFHNRLIFMLRKLVQESWPRSRRRILPIGLAKYIQGIVRLTVMR